MHETARAVGPLVGVFGFMFALVAACSGSSATSLPPDEPAVAPEGGDAPPDETPGADADADASPPAPVVERCDTAGALETVRCGVCGRVERFCRSEGAWEYGDCVEPVGACRPGESRERPCGQCGAQRETCTDSCTWTPVGSCADEGRCKPGTVMRVAEGCASGTREVRCSDACVYEPASGCSVEPCSRPGSTESVRCGNCGTRTRFCSSAGEWEYGPCSNEGGCVPGSTDTTSCGNCGTQSRRCNERCEWTIVGACANSGECAPGATTQRSTGCPGDQTRPFTCNATCRFEPSGACAARPSQGGLLEPCTNGACAPQLVCERENGQPTCRKACSSDRECPGSTSCIGTRASFCSDACTPFSNAGCPTAMKCNYEGIVSAFDDTEVFVCTGVGPGRQGDGCATSADCARDFVCASGSDGGSGRCRKMCDSARPCAAPARCRRATVLSEPVGAFGWCDG